MSAERSHSSERERSERHVVFFVAARASTLPIEVVREVVDLRGLTVVPMAPPAVLGIMSLRGTIVAVLDAHHLLTGAAASEPPSKVLVVVRDGVVLCGLAVHRVASVTAVPAASLLRNHVASADPLVAGVHDLGSAGLVSAIDPTRLFSHLDALRMSALGERTPSLPDPEEIGR